MTKLCNKNIKQEKNPRGTQQANLLGNSAISRSLIRSFNGPRMMTGRQHFTTTQTHTHHYSE